MYSLCQASYNDYTKELCLEITGNEDASLTYSLSEIKEEYIDKAKKNKVSVIYEGNKFYPVVLKRILTILPEIYGVAGENYESFNIHAY